MAGDALSALRRLRALEVEAVLRDLADHIQQEARARTAVATLTADLARESDLVRALSASDPRDTPSERWQARMREAIAEATTRADNAVAEIDSARTRLGAARGALRAVEVALDQRAAVRAVVTARRTQDELDDIARHNGGRAG